MLIVCTIVLAFAQSVLGLSQTILITPASSKFPDYSGSVKITGNVTLTEAADNVVVFSIYLSGFSASVQGGLYLHTGASCASLASLGGAFYAPFDSLNPYSAAEFVSDAHGIVDTTFPVKIGYSFQLALERALEIYTKQEQQRTSVACVPVSQTTASSLQANLARFGAYTGNNNVSGLVSFTENNKQVSVSYILKGFSSMDNEGSVYVVKDTNCEKTTTYLWKPETAPNPWLNSSNHYAVNAQGDAEGAFQLSEEQLGLLLSEMRGHGVVVALNDGTIVACGIIPVPIQPTDEHEGDWALGVLCSTLASFGTVVGMLLQKWSHMQESKKNVALERKTHVMCRPLWWLSLFFMILVPAPLDIAAFAFASQSLLAPLSGVTLLLNAVFAPLVLKEKVTRRDLLASVLIALGAGITTVFGAHTQTQYTVPTLYILFARPAWIFFQVLANVGVVVLWVAVRLALSERSRFVNLRVVCKSYLAYLLALLVALSGAQQMVFTKTVSELIAASINGDMQFTYFLTYVLIVLAIWMAVFQIGYLNKGLELFDAVYFLPLYNAALIVLCIVVGGIYFDEVAHVSWWQILLFVAGVMICLGGVLLLKKRPAAIDGNTKQEALITDDELSVPSQIYSDSDL